MSIKLNSKGFAPIEMLLIVIIVVMLGGVGYYVFHAQSKSTDNLNQASSESQSAVVDKNKKTQEAENTLITAAVKAYGPADTVNVKNIIGNNAEGSVGSTSGGGTTFIAHKDSSGKWSVVFEGQQMPGKAVGTKYGLPKSWYSTSY
ncbi:MAG TPA: hypothetical protein VH234_03930 [Candidatus Saccharimonadales bacterium]|jgi:uncharacterized protein (UPF0333 family)|nr:hypothetical protein [Candidatus Saccharimonadales bacterium]